MFAMYSAWRPGCQFGRNRVLRFWGKVIVCLLAATLPLLPIIANAGPSGTIEQASNGTSSLPISPVDWVNGNITERKAHFVEGHSIPFRLVVTGLSNGTHRVLIGWDTRNSGRYAMDYLTHFDRLLPHDQFGSHTVAETVSPLRGLSGSFGAPGTFPVPAPSGMDSPAPGQPAASFGSLPATERAFTIYNGEITNAEYVDEESLTNTLAQTVMAIDFTASNSTVVILFGGRIAAKKDWGSGTTASGVATSP